MKVRSTLMALAVASVGVSAFVPAHAADVRKCDQASAFPGRKVIKQAVGTQTYYLDDRLKKNGTPPAIVSNGSYGTWQYLESNGIAGLQTGGLQAAFDAIDEEEGATEVGEHDTQYCTEAGGIWTGVPDTILS